MIAYPTGRVAQENRPVVELAYQLKNKDFQNDQIVSKLVAAITYETRYEAAKVERTRVFYLTVGSKLEVPERKGFDMVNTYYKYYNVGVNFIVEQSKPIH